MQDNHFTLKSQQKSSGQLAASFLLQILPSLKSTPHNECDLITLIPDKEDRREFTKSMAIHFEDEEKLQALSNQEYEPTTYKSWMLAEYLACLLDPSTDSRSQEQQWREQEKFYDMLLEQIDEDLSQDYSQEEIEAMQRVQRRLYNNE